MSSPESRPPPPEDAPKLEADRPAAPPPPAGDDSASAAEAARPASHPSSGIDPEVLAEAGLTEEDMFEHESGERWDKDDPRRKDDSFAPPTVPCECHCLHCGRTFSSEGIWFQQVINDPQGFKGFWMCPTPNCSGAGFTFDIFPTDPSHPANEGWHYDDEDEGLDAGTDGDEDPDDEDDEAWSEDPALAADAEEHDEYDPDETKYKELDEFYGGDDDDDLEGEEWKFGLQPGERPAEPVWRESARREWEEEQKKYDEPDQRPRQLDWSDRDDRHQFKDDDIPF